MKFKSNYNSKASVRRVNNNTYITRNIYRESAYSVIGKLYVLKYAILGILIVGVVGFVMLGAGSIDALNKYNSLTAARSISAVGKKLEFIRTYTVTTGDATFATNLGYDSDTVDGWMSDITSGPDVAGTIHDLTDLAKATANIMINNAKSKDKIYDQGNMYEPTISYNGVTSTHKLRNDCSGGSTFMLQVLGELSTIDGGESLRNKITRSDFGNIQVGALLSRPPAGGKSGHCAMVVGGDASGWKISGFGSNNAITKIASNGYESIKTTEQLKTDGYKHFMNLSDWP